MSEFLKGAILGIASYLLFFLLFQYTIISHPALDPSSLISVDAMNLYLLDTTVTSIKFLIITSAVGFSLNFLNEKFRHLKNSYLNYFVLALVSSTWLLLYMPAALLFFSSMIIDFIKYDHTFRDIKTGTILDLERTYMALLRWGFFFGLIALPLNFLRFRSYRKKVQNG